MGTNFEGLQGRLNIPNELRKYIEVDHHEVVRIGDPENSEAMKVVEPDFSKEIYLAAVHERWTS